MRMLRGVRPPSFAITENRLFDHVVGHRPGVMRIDIKRKRLGHADGIGDLDGAARGQPRRHHVLGKITGDVGRRTVDLGRVLPLNAPPPCGAAPP